MPVRLRAETAETAEELLAALEEEARNAIIPRKLRRACREYVIEKLVGDAKVVPLRAAATRALRAEALLIAQGKWVGAD